MLGRQAAHIEHGRIGRVAPEEGGHIGGPRIELPLLFVHEVAVEEGRVSLRSHNADSGSAVLISKGELSILPTDGKPTIPKEADLAYHLGWLTRDIEFRNTPFLEILSQLERWYDIHFILDKKIPVSDQLTIHVQNRPVEEIIELIADLMTLEFRKEGKTIYLFSRD